MVSATKPALMIQGTGSHVGKSLIVAGLCRALVKRGIRIAPFKPQNMSNNAAVTTDGGEIGRAQALQARAAGLPPSVHMNPVLLKPESEIGAQVIVQGNRFATLDAADYGQRKAELMTSVLESFSRVAEGVDLVVVEGAGSPAEVNLRENDIANMGFAEAAELPVVLVGDIDRGGVIATLVGTYEVLDERDRQRIKGFLINKFRGDAGLFHEGLATIESRTAWPCMGVVPWFEQAHRLPAEDALGIESQPSAGDGNLVIAVPMLRRIANFDDLDPLGDEADVSVVMVKPGSPIPANADLVLVPGTKSTIGELNYIRKQGWDIDIIAHYRRGGRVLGLCGGYQMLGRKVSDPQGMEGPPGSVDGLGLLDIETVINGDKTTVSVSGRHKTSGHDVSGYEIHLGHTSGPDCARPALEIAGRPEGARSSDGLVMGTYVHGLFASDGFRGAFLREFGAVPTNARYEASVETVLDGLAEHLEAAVAIDRLLENAGYKQKARAKTKTTKHPSAQAPI